MSAVGRVLGVSKRRQGCAVSTTLVGDGSTKTFAVDSDVVDFDEDGGDFRHQPTGDIYTYTSADKDLETITLAAGLPIGKTLTAGDALYVDPPADDYFADIAVDDIAEDAVSARVPQGLRAILEEGVRQRKKGPLVRAEPGDEEWEVTELVGEEPVLDNATFYSGDIKPTARAVTGGVLVDGGWLKCDGSTFNRATYPDLFNAIGTTYGSTSSTNFKVPDLRDRTIFGTGTAVSLGSSDGAAVGDRGPAHTHVVFGGNHQHGINSTNHNGVSTTTGGGALDRVNSINGTLSGSHAHGGNTQFEGGHDHTGFTGSGIGTSNPLGYIGINYVIKT